MQGREIDALASSTARGYRRLSRIFIQSDIQQDSSYCQRCHVSVFQQERVGPLHDVVFHKSCFCCIICGCFLTMKNYWCNQEDALDLEVYCSSHVPRIGGSSLDKDAIGIKRAMEVQQILSCVTIQQMTSSPDVPLMDGKAMEIRNAVDVQRARDLRLKATNRVPGVDATSLHIQGAIEAQLLQKKPQALLEKHHYPPLIVSTKHMQLPTSNCEYEAYVITHL